MDAGSSEQEMLRAARNQALYRAVNEKLDDLNRMFHEVASLPGMWVCECADPNCIELMELTIGEYEALRGHPNRFAVVAGHVYSEVEHVVEEHDRYVVVEKLGATAAFAAGHDPRARSQAA